MVLFFIIRIKAIMHYIKSDFYYQNTFFGILVLWFKFFIPIEKRYGLYAPTESINIPPTVF